MASSNDGRSQNHATAASCTANLESAVARLETLLGATHEDVRELVQRVGAQNNRIGKIEVKCAAHDSISISRTRTEVSVEKKMESTDERIGELEKFRNQAAGAGKATLGIFTQILTILALVLACWRYIESRPEHQTTRPTSSPVMQQGLK